MWDKFAKALKNLHRNQKGMTGLETAIILIAFVTVASVLAYSVLSAGIFSAERGKETVFEGLAGAQATMELRGSVLATSSDNSSVDHILFNVALALPGETVDMTGTSGDNIVVINYIDDEVHDEDVTWTTTLLSEERGEVAILEDDEVMQVDVTVPDAATIDIYHSFTLQLVPPTGAPIIIQRQMGNDIDLVNDLL